MNFYILETNLSKKVVCSWLLQGVGRYLALAFWKHFLLELLQGMVYAYHNFGNVFYCSFCKMRAIALSLLETSVIAVCPSLSSPTLLLLGFLSTPSLSQRLPLSKAFLPSSTLSSPSHFLLSHLSHKRLLAPLTRFSFHSIYLCYAHCTTIYKRVVHIRTIIFTPFQ